METGGSKKRTNGTESPSVLVPKRQRVVLEEFPDLSVPDYHPNLNKSASTLTLSLLPNSDLDNPVCNKTNAKCESVQIVEPYVSDVSVYLRTMEVIQSPIFVC